MGSWVRIPPGSPIQRLKAHYQNSKIGPCPRCVRKATAPDHKKCGQPTTRLGLIVANLHTVISFAGFIVDPCEPTGRRQWRTAMATAMVGHCHDSRKPERRSGSRKPAGRAELQQDLIDVAGGRPRDLLSDAAAPTQGSVPGLAEVPGGVRPIDCRNRASRSPHGGPRFSRRAPPGTKRGAPPKECPIINGPRRNPVAG
jgi:hypothetical protein